MEIWLRLDDHAEGIARAMQRQLSDLLMQPYRIFLDGQSMFMSTTNVKKALRPRVDQVSAADEQMTAVTCIVDHVKSKLLTSSH